MHRLKADMFENATPTAGIDDLLKVKGGDMAALARQPGLPGSDPYARATSGLVADGVTPLLFSVSAGEELTREISYDVTFSKYSPFLTGPNLSNRYRVLRNGKFEKIGVITLSPSQPSAYIVLEPIEAKEIQNNVEGVVDYRLTLLRRDSTRYNGDSPSIAFGVRKPPVVLVHGYNAGQIGLDTQLAQRLILDRGSDFVIPVEYGIEQDNWGNTFGTLEAATVMLSWELGEQVESRRWPGSNQWAWTRYDAVGHSQGGVLLRFLCSSGRVDKQVDVTMRFRNESNLYRGRFRRVVTVGSPHFGSTIAHLGHELMENDVELNAVPDPAVKGIFEKLLQPKFRVRALPTGPATPLDLNNLFLPDPTSRIHMLGATIDQGQAPGPRPGIETLPWALRMLYLQKGDDSNQVFGKRWGEWIAPYGSDGVVDLRSQMASKSPNNPRYNSSNIDASEESEDIAHALAINSWTTSLMFGTSNTETDSLKIGLGVVDLLNGPNYAFGPFPSAAECTPLHDEMNATAAAIDEIINLLDPSRITYRNQTVAAARAFATSEDEPIAASAEQTPSAETLNFGFDPPSGESIAGEVTWSVVVYGPDGLTTEGLTLTPSGAFGENVQIDIAAGVVGEVVASVQFPSSSGKTVIGEPAIIASRPSGALTGVEIRPDSVGLLAGPTVPLEVWGLYDNGTSNLLFINPDNTTWSSGDSSLATVDGDGRVTLVTAGETTVQATYNGHIATAAIDVWDPAPNITSTSSASGELGQPFNYQITADGSPVSFAARDLPDGLAVNQETGLITGNPTYEGRYIITVVATNDDGQSGSSQLVLTVTGTNQAPTAIGIDNGSVAALQPAGTLVGQLGTADANPLNTFSYELVAGDGDANNGLFSISGDSLMASVTIDPSSLAECQIRLRSTDSGGLSVEQAITLPVLGAPQVQVAPNDTIVFKSDSFSLRVEAKGRAPMTYQWLENGLVIPGANSTTLNLPAEIMGDQQFSVFITNEYGDVTSSSATVTTVPLSFGAWASKLAEAGSPRITPDGDLNGDGAQNRFDYFFGTAPNETLVAMPFVRINPEGPAYVFRRSTRINPASMKILSSLTLDAWSEFMMNPDDIAIAPINLGSEEVEIQLPPGGKQFFRLEVDQ